MGIQVHENRFSYLVMVIINPAIQGEKKRFVNALQKLIKSKLAIQKTEILVLRKSDQKNDFCERKVLQKTWMKTNRGNMVKTAKQQTYIVNQA